MEKLYLLCYRSYTKEEKEQENNKRNSPTKAVNNDKAFIGRGRDSVDARVIKDMIRHHLERTTGGSGESFTYN